MALPRVLLADDHALILGAFEKLLAEECDVVGQVSDGRALVAAADRLKPDLIVLDIAMPLLNGLEAARQIKQQLRHVKLVFLTMNEDPDLAAEAFRSGASAYLLKRSAVSELTTAIREVMQGRTYITPLVAELLASECAADEEGPLHNRLSERELQVFTRIARGVSPAVMANELGLSVKTVSTYRARILEKMGMRSNAEIAAYAVRNQLVE